MANLERYTPIEIQGGSPEELADQFNQELIRIAGLFSAIADKVEQTNIAPDKFENGDIKYADGTDWNPGNGEGVYLRQSSVWEKLALFSELPSVVYPITVDKGGTGVATLANAGVLIGNGTGVVQVTGAGTVKQVFTSNGAGNDPTFQALPAGGSTVYTAGTTYTWYPVGFTSDFLGTKITALNETDSFGGLTNNFSNYEKTTEARLGPGISGVLKIKMKVSQAGGGGVISYAQIYRNGAVVGTERTASVTTWVEFIEDIGGWNEGDLLQIYQKIGTEFYSGWVKVQVQTTEIPRYWNIINWKAANYADTGVVGGSLS